MKGKPRSGDDKPSPEDSGKTPLLVKWDLTNASPVYTLIDVMVKWYYYYNNQIEKSRESREKVKGILTTMASHYGPLILCHFWMYGATTTMELIHLYKLSKQTINLMLLKLERLGLIRRACEVDRPRGKSGQTSWIYVLSIADPQAETDAQLRYNEIVKRKQREKRERRKERRRLAAEEMRRKAEARARRKGALLQVLITEFTDLFEKTRKPVPLQEIRQRVKAAGLEGDYAYLDVAVKLEEGGVETGYYVAGKLDPNWNPPPEILWIREERRGKL